MLMMRYTHGFSARSQSFSNHYLWSITTSKEKARLPSVFFFWESVQPKVANFTSVIHASLHYLLLANILVPLLGCSITAQTKIYSSLLTVNETCPLLVYLHKDTLCKCTRCSSYLWEHQVLNNMVRVGLIIRFRLEVPRPLSSSCGCQGHTTNSSTTPKLVHCSFITITIVYLSRQW